MTTATIDPAPPADVPLTVPVAAARIGVSVHVVDALLGKRPDLAARLFRAGWSRMVTPDVLADLRTILPPPPAPEAEIVA